MQFIPPIRFRYSSKLVENGSMKYKSLLICLNIIFLILAGCSAPPQTAADQFRDKFAADIAQVHANAAAEMAKLYENLLDQAIATSVQAIERAPETQRAKTAERAIASIRKQAEAYAEKALAYDKSKAKTDKEIRAVEKAMASMVEGRFLKGVAAIEAVYLSDTWNDVYSGLRPANGTWTGSSKASRSIKEFTESAGGRWNAMLQDHFGDMTVNVNLDMRATINTTTMHQTGTLKSIQSFSGGKIKEAWPSMKKDFIAMGDTTKDSNYSTTSTKSFDEPIPNGTQVNKNGKQVRIPYLGKDYIILTKK